MLALGSLLLSLPSLVPFALLGHPPEGRILGCFFVEGSVLWLSAWLTAAPCHWLPRFLRGRGGVHQPPVQELGESRALSEVCFFPGNGWLTEALLGIPSGQ